MRGLVSDGLYDYLQYWVDAYKQQGLRNQLTDMRITHSVDREGRRATSWYDAVTIRIWGTGKDFVVRTADRPASCAARKHRERAYSEYWTLIRSAGRKGAPKADADVRQLRRAARRSRMAGECEHCGAHVTAGEFDWVLSKIEQDDTYRG